jgi:hypothetical protein
MSKSRFGFVALCAIAAPVIPAPQLGAVPVKVTFEGIVTDTHRDADAYFNAGDTMTGAFYYETSVSPHPIQRWYRPFTVAHDGYVTIGAYTALIVGEGESKLSLPILVVNNNALFENPPFEADQFTANPHADGPVLGLMTPNHLNFNLFDSTASVFDNRSVPALLPPLSRFDTANWLFLFKSTEPRDFTYRGTVGGLITGFETTIIPEPSTLALCIAAVFAPASTRTNKRRYRL